MNHRRTAFVLLAIVMFAGSLQAAIPAAERQALIALYDATAGDSWTNNSGWKTPPLDTDGFALPGTENTWYGVTTDEGNTTVLGLLLSFNQLSGSIPASLGDLSNLVGLNLSDNLLSGPIPAELGDLSDLVYLILSSNGLSGTIPTSLGSLVNLIELTLDVNQLNGSIPSELGGLTSLDYLGLSNNQLSGPLPASLGNLAAVTDIGLYNNQLSGSIPPQLGNLSTLTYLDLGFNQLSGRIPEELGGLSALQNLLLDSNQLRGLIPSSLTNLVSLLSGNSEFSYNALYATDSGLIAFLNDIDPGWDATQTIAPTDVSAETLGGSTALVTWTPILYQSDAGGYIVSVGSGSGGPYSEVGQTADKSVSSMTVSGLAPGTPHYFVVRTRTDVHAGNQNIVESEESAEASATTLSQLLVTGTASSGGSPLSGVVLSGLPGDPVTNGSGMYQGLVDPGWSGTVTPTLTSYTFVPSSRTYTSVSSDQWNQNYEGTLVPASITVTSPNGGEAWAAGSSQSVTWTASGLTGTVTIDLYKGGVYQKTLGTAEAAAGTFAWLIGIGEAPGADYRVLVWQGSVSDESDGDFAILQAAATKKVDFDGDGQEDILWRYYGTGGRNRVWFLGNTDPGTQPLLVADPQMEIGASESEQDAASRSDSMGHGRVRMIANPRGNLVVADPREAVSPENWREALSVSTGAGKSSIPMPEMGARLLRPGVQDPEHAAAFADPVTAAEAPGAPASQTEILAATGVLGGADILAVADLTWQIMGTGDFNNDGKTDVLWRYNGTGGRVRVWYMDGTSVIAGADIGSVSDLDWQIVGTGDFNGDGKIDLLWHHAVSGRVRVWYLDGVSIIAGADISTVADLNWKIMGTGDFNGDGHVDLLWRHSVSGRNRVWFMNGTSILSGADLIGVTDQNWQIAGTGDYNGDGHIDVLWRYNGTGGYVYIWYLNGTSWIGTEKLPPVTDLNWRVVSR